MITANVIARTYHIKYKNGTGTCFTIDFEGKQYFVTAKHVIENLKNGEIVELFYKKKWQKVQVKLTGHSKYSDVSVFATDILLNKDLPLPTKFGGIAYGQDLYFLGFPYGLKSEVGSLNREFPFPLVKKGILSAIFMEPPAKYMLIDGHNNPGFSGGPVVFKEGNSNVFNVCGIISSYRFELQETYLNNKPTQIKLKANTGIVIAYTIDNAIELIKSNPNGKEI
ncbi:serine protease [Gaetbulibacter sp. M235]|uniref:S1 family peptidase n=1 Tax=Gaetbulibacter sp. M235 TaxID=3126510 RepID=UPI00374F4155